MTKGHTRGGFNIRQIRQATKVKNSEEQMIALIYFVLPLNDGSFRIFNVSRYNVRRVLPYLFLTSLSGLRKSGQLPFSSLEPLLCLRAFFNARIKSPYKQVYVAGMVHRILVVHMHLGADGRHRLFDY